MILENEVKEYLNSIPAFRHKKTDKIYRVIGLCLNCTNAQDGQYMIMYSDGKSVFVREEKEFNEKFEKIK